ncbi:hypothetical protein Pcinc_020331 [Petrolisthes cinctipes]|uniref:N-acetyltransferase domain-containing protein n=1 Tax=Petrolisthes cinctipes TaxID=88211 RepID=A0AAE1FID9_PETCI|nr:hypothetical protein Pcinc_020331 [Petrolisthes cinctipes]
MTGPNFVPNWSDGPCLYCGCTSLNKPEELLCCELCRRPAHIACLGSDGPDGTLLADNFFTLVCQACAGVEHNAVARAKMSTVQVLLLTLYNLHVQKTQSARNGFYHWKIHIYNFINNHWKEIYGPESRKKKKKVVQASLSGQLSHYSQYFESGHRTLGEGGWYRLAHTLSPAAIIARFKQEKRPQSKASASRAEPNAIVHNEEVIKKEPEEVDIKLDEDQEGRRGSWFTEVDFLKPEMRPPLELFDSGSEEDIGGAEISVKSEVFVKEELSGTSVEDTEMDGEMIIVDGLGSEVIQPQCPPPSSADPLAVCGKPTLFNKPSHPPSSQLTTIKPVHRDPATPKKKKPNMFHLRCEIIGLHNLGVSVRKIAQQLDLSPSTVCRWIKRHKDGAELTDLKRKPRPRLTSSLIDESIRQAVEENPFTNAHAIRDELQLNVSASTIRRRLQEAGINQGLPMEQEWFTDQHRASRLTFAKKYVDKDVEFWSRVVFTDEKKFITTNHGNIEICRINNTRYKRKNIQEEIKSKSVIVNVWGWVSIHECKILSRDCGVCSLRRLSHYEERELLKKLDRGPLSPHLHRLRRKLALRKQKLEHGLSVFNLEDKVKFLTCHGHLRIWHEQTHDHPALYQHHNTTQNRVLDRFQVSSSDVTYKRQDENTSFLVRLGGQLENNLPFIHSPYTLRKLKPFIMRDFESEPLKLRLLRELESYLHRGDPNWSPSPRASLDYCYITPQHIPAINQLARQFFWPGIDLSEVLQYPDHTCVVLYRKLVVGFGVLVPDTGFNEAYLSYLLVHPEWRRAGMATFILYHLIQTCAGKDITLHVSATNPALILYQRFGFKVEEFLSNFYDKYLPEDSPECKHAMYLRLSR